MGFEGRLEGGTWHVGEILAFEENPGGKGATVPVELVELTVVRGGKEVPAFSARAGSRVKVYVRGLAVARIRFGSLLRSSSFDRSQVEVQPTERDRGPFLLEISEVGRPVPAARGGGIELRGQVARGTFKVGGGVGLELRAGSGALLLPVKISRIRSDGGGLGRITTGETGRVTVLGSPTAAIPAGARLWGWVEPWGGPTTDWEFDTSSTSMPIPPNPLRPRRAAAVGPAQRAA